MKISFRLGQILKPHLDDHGFYSTFAEQAELDRHWLRKALHNEAVSYKLDSVQRICDVLIKHYAADLQAHNVQPGDLPGALFARDPESFWKMLAGCEKLEFCLGKRRNPDWHGTDYVSVADAQLWASLLHVISARDRRAGARRASDEKTTEAQQDGPRFPQPRFVRAPPRDGSYRGKAWQEVVDVATETYESCQQQAEKYGLLVVGSPKVNPVVDLCFARIFTAEAYSPEHNKDTPDQRSCPIMFRYRTTDPKPPSCCGGCKLSRRKNFKVSGICYETADKEWDILRCDGTNDAAFVLYNYNHHLSHVELAVGGFSGLATSLLAEKFEQIAPDLWPPQFQSKKFDVGLFLVHFTAKSRQAMKDGIATSEVIRICDNALHRRLENESNASPVEGDV